MKKINEKLATFLLVYYYTIFIVVLTLISGCGSDFQLHGVFGDKELKKCCEKTVQAVYDYEGLTIDDVE